MLMYSCRLCPLWLLQPTLWSYSVFSILPIAMVVSSLLCRSFACWEGWTGDWVVILVDYNMLRVPVNASARQVLRALGQNSTFIMTELGCHLTVCFLTCPSTLVCLLSSKTLMIGDSPGSDLRRKIREFHHVNNKTVMKKMDVNVLQQVHDLPISFGVHWDGCVVGFCNSRLHEFIGTCWIYKQQIISDSRTSRVVECMINPSESPQE